MTTYEYIVQQREREENDYSTDVPPSSQREKKKVLIHTVRKYNISCSLCKKKLSFKEKSGLKV